MYIYIEYIYLGETISLIEHQYTNTHEICMCKCSIPPAPLLTKVNAVEHHQHPSTFTLQHTRRFLYRCPVPISNCLI